MKITSAILEAKVRLLNKVTGNPIESFAKTENGYQANIGNYFVERCNGCFNLVQIVSTSGGQHNLTSGTRLDIVRFIDAYIQGYQEGKA